MRNQQLTLHAVAVSSTFLPRPQRDAEISSLLGGEAAGRDPVLRAVLGAVLGSLSCGCVPAQAQEGA